MLATSLGSVLLLTAEPGIAQSDAAETLADLKACAEIERDRARLACFDGVLAGEPLGEPEPIAAADVTPAPTQESAAAGAANAPVTASSEAVDVSTDRVTAGPAAAPSAAASAQAPAATAAAAPVGVATASAASPSAASAADPRPAPAVIPAETSSNQPAAATESPTEAPGASSPGGEAEGRRIVTIVDVNLQLSGSARFTTEDGQVYRQTSGGSLRGRFPDVPFEASIETGTLSSAFLSVGGNRRRVRVTLVD